jgi:hypothetical protein
MKNTLINNLYLLVVLERKNIGVEMKNKFLEILQRLFIPQNPNEVLTSYEYTTTFYFHDSVIVSTVEVKEHGKSLLIKLPEATLWHAAPGDTLLPLITGIPRLSFDSPSKEMHVNYSCSSIMSHS